MEKGGACFSPRPRQRACQDPLTRQGGDALRASKNLGFIKLLESLEIECKYSSKGCKAV